MITKQVVKTVLPHFHAAASLVQEQHDSVLKEAIQKLNNGKLSPEHALEVIARLSALDTVLRKMSSS